MDTHTAQLLPESNLLITGLPRSGTTLATAIIDGLENSLALSEPQSHVDLLAHTTTGLGLSRSLAICHAQERSRLRHGLPVMDRRAADGSPLTDYVNRTDGAAKVRRPEGTIARPDLTDDFLFATKHNALYTAVLPEIVADGRFSVLALVRNPLRCIASWQTVPFPIAGGRLPAGEPYWRELRSVGTRVVSILEKQVMIVELFFRRYLDLEPAVRLVRYEDMIASAAYLPQLLERSVLRPVDVVEKTPPIVDEEFTSHALDLLRRNAPSALRVYPELA